ncbi:hypothetical protein [Thetidibacter halocola]|nr:hypothetical protein [Thetidibacter halocola]
MGGLLAHLHGAAGTLGIAGLAGLWVVKAAVGWKLLRWWRGRRPG